MEPEVRYEREGSVGLIAVDNPPVNALSQAVRAGLLAALDEALADPAAKVLALYGKGRTFIAGADIKEFGKPLAEPTLRQVIERFENAKKPIVAVLHGTALGGGLELALGCHYRIALPGAKVGLPEVKLGLLPGAGGTQRLPRLTGVEAAIEMITSGRHVEAEEAAKLGIVDAAVHETDPRKAALAYGETVAIDNASVKRVRDLDQKLKVAPGLLEAEKQKVAQRYRGRFSPLKCVEAVEAAVTLPFDQGLKRERELFDQCMASAQRKAMIHVFFGERAVAKVPGMDEVQPRPVKEAAVIGAGTMGGGIAMCFANAGLPVTLVETTREPLERGLERIRSNYEGSVRRGSLSLKEMEHRMTLIRPSLDLGTVATADLVIEAVFEKLEIKQEVFAKLDELAKPGAVLATNTSYLNVDRIAAATGRPQDVLGMHFFSPANVMRLLEVVRAAKTADDALKTALAVGRQLGKVAVVAGVCDGFIGNRMLRQYQRQTYYMLEDGALPQEIDAAVTGFGFAMGPFAVYDLAGLDISYANRKREAATRDPAERYVHLPDQLVELGRLGQKSGAGWYRYEKGDRRPHPDPVVQELVLAASKEKGITRRPFSQEEILTRLLAALVNEGAKILGEGIALRSVDIDMVWINGYGFPAHEGGPMFWADQRGPAKVLADVERFAKDDAWSWRPAPLLVRLAREGKGFGDVGSA
jgi:3-hydroxyacyl-CoA dehydrogenase